jgi:uncharacterized membrane protein
MSLFSTRRSARGARRARRLGERSDLSVPRGASPRIGARYDADAFGRFSEAIARFLGTGRFLVGQTVIVVGWIVLNTIGFVKHWDPYPFILLNLAFSTQAAYAAPLILLAQNRQDDRDRANIERDREVAARTQADTEFLARELAAVRVALADVVTTQDLDESLSRLAKLITDRDQPGAFTSPDGHLPGAARLGRLGRLPQVTQNSLPSGSRMTTALPRISSSRQATLAPAFSRRATCSSTRCWRSSPRTSRPATRTSRWTRFFAVLGSGTRWKYSRGPSPAGSTQDAWSPNCSSGIPIDRPKSSQVSNPGGGGSAV